MATAVGPYWDRQTDRRTPDSCIDPAPHTMRAVPKAYQMSELWDDNQNTWYRYELLTLVVDRRVVYNSQPRSFYFIPRSVKLLIQATVSSVVDRTTDEAAKKTR